MNTFKNDILTILDLDYGKSIKDANTVELYNAVSKAAMKNAHTKWEKPAQGKKACYFSAEFLIGRLIYSNLLNLGLLNQLSELFNENNIDIGIFEDIEDAALGNGGLGRLAACFLDSGATKDLALNGYGIRYRYGLFKQYFENGFQKETADNWQRFGDPWSVRREEDRVKIMFKDQTIYAVPYDTPVIGYGAKTVNTLRLWQAEPVHEFDFQLFNDQKFEPAMRERDDAEAISGVLYPNDDTDKGKRLRLKQQYFFSSASLQDIFRTYRKKYGGDFSHFAGEYAIQLNDTHPVVSIPEFIRILVTQENVSFGRALKIAKQTFAYTNHTIMAEALEKWDVKLFKSVIPDVYRYVAMINKALQKELTSFGITGDAQKKYLIIDENNKINMARLAVFATHSTNGVAQIHTDIIKNIALKEWYDLYPERFNNKTNGITQRRWLALCNMELSGFINDKIGNAWITDLDKLKDLERYKNDPDAIGQFAQIKRIKKQQLAEYIEKREGVRLNPDFIFDVQVKRLHEYKRQLLNILHVLSLYLRLRENPQLDIRPRTFLFGAKAAPGYMMAKQIIRLICSTAKEINADPAVRGMIRVEFLEDYRVTLAEMLMPAAEISEQISLAGTEASGTGNMKLMINGAVTIGTLDGANIEMRDAAGDENILIFGLKADEVEKLRNSGYSSTSLYQNDPALRMVIDKLRSGIGGIKFQEIADSLIGGPSRAGDTYMVLRDFADYCRVHEEAMERYADPIKWNRMSLCNIASAGVFSADRALSDYASRIWHIKRW